MSLIEQLKTKASSLGKMIVLPEGDDERVVNAAETILKEKIARLIILNPASGLRERFAGAGITDGYELVHIDTDDRLGKFISEYYNMRKDKGLTEEQAAADMNKPLYFGMMLVRMGYADGCVAGAVNTTADVLRTSFRVVGVKKGVKVVSSFFIMVTDKKELGADGIFLFADCAVVSNPTSEELSDIAISSADNARVLLGVEPKVAMLSFSTKGSSSDDSVDKVRTATELVNKKRPDILCDGEMQIDAAIVPSVAARKAPGSAIAGQANVLIFPDLNAANIGYKLVERFSGAKAIGPVLQGLNKPVNDLSRGASYTDIVNTVVITCIEE